MYMYIHVHTCTCMYMYVLIIHFILRHKQTDDGVWKVTFWPIYVYQVSYVRFSFNLLSIHLLDWLFIDDWNRYTHPHTYLASSQNNSVLVFGWAPFISRLSMREMMHYIIRNFLSPQRYHYRSNTLFKSNKILMLYIIDTCTCNKGNIM